MMCKCGYDPDKGGGCQCGADHSVVYPPPSKRKPFSDLTKLANVDPSSARRIRRKLERIVMRGRGSLAWRQRNFRKLGRALWEGL